MSSKHKSSNPESNPITNFIQNLLNPPVLFNPLSNESKTQSEKQSKSSNFLMESDSMAEKIMKIKTQEKAKSLERYASQSERFKSKDQNLSSLSTNKQYGQNSLIRISSLSSDVTSNVFQQTPKVKNHKFEKYVDFKSNLIAKNRYDRRPPPNTVSKSPPILKNKNKHSSVPVINSYNSLQLGSTPSNEMKEVRALKANQVIKKRYDIIMEKFKVKYKNHIQRELRSQDKYRDQLFPPIYSSLFRTNVTKNAKRQGEEITWMRIGELLAGQSLTIYNPNEPSNIEVFRGQESWSSEYFSTSLNCIKNNKYLLEKMFEKQEVNGYGIYLVKIFQESVWKYVIVDDFIPVMHRVDQATQHKQFRPAFLDVRISVKANSKINSNQAVRANSTQAVRANSTQLFQIWPFLLEKAYANYYSNYQSLRFGNVLDFIAEISGSTANLWDLTKLKIINKNPNKNDVKSCEQKKIEQKLKIKLKEPNAIVIGEILNVIVIGEILKVKDEGQDKQHIFIPIQNVSMNSKNKASNEKQQKGQSILFQKESLNFDLLLESYTKLYIFNPTIWENSSMMTVGMNGTNGSASKTRHLFNKNANEYKNANVQQPQGNRLDISLRSFIVKEPAEFQLSVRQKQQRFYQNSILAYQYMWIRVFIVQKEVCGHYRWINGRYSNSKNINFQLDLEAGQYVIILMPEWRISHSYDLTLLLTNATNYCSLHKQDYHEGIVEQACEDLAQRFGKINQVNLFICCYSMISEESGLIIQNINNERINGDVRIMRSINGLNASVEIMPFNKQFYENVNKTHKSKSAYKHQITVDIAQNQAYTVVLMMKGGLDHAFLQAFDFGN